MDLVISNVVDAYRENMALIPDPALRAHELLDSFCLAERALLWAGDSKLVVTSLPVPQAQVDYLRQAMGYRALEALAPREPGDSLCDDILRERDLFERIVASLRGHHVRLISFVARPQVHAVADALRAEGLAVSTPECPPAGTLSVQAELDSKAGFRRFFSSIQPRVPGLCLPEGDVAQDVAEAARLADGLLSRGKGCICKPNNSQGGVGFLKLRPGEVRGSAARRQGEIRRLLAAAPAMANDVIVVEELIEMDTSAGGGSPSIEMRIPADPGRDVEFMYLCGQLLTADGYFYGADMHANVVQPVQQQALEAAGAAVAREIRALGYVGIFDMDLVVGRDGQIYAVEINTRRTGCTHAHEAAEAVFGPRYWERAAVICNNELAHGGEPFAYEELAAAMADLLFPIGERREGILPAIVSSLPARRFGYVALGPDIGRVRELTALLQERLLAAGRPPVADLEPAAQAMPLPIPPVLLAGRGPLEP